MSSETLDITAVRKRFPTLTQPQIFFDNAGGSQILGTVADSIRDYLYTHNVQLGATYKAGEQSTEAYNKAYKAAAEYVGVGKDEILIGPSTTQLYHNTSLSLLPFLQSHPSPEIVLSKLDHEANTSSWVYLASILPHLKLVWWDPTVTDPAQATAEARRNPHLTPESLKPLLTKNTVLVTATHATNILGSITDICALAELVHSAPHEGALLCVDGVALAPHRPLSLDTLGADIYAFSWYKLYGPHIAQLYVRREVQERCLRSLGHYFKSGDTLEERLGLAGGSYELLQAIPEVTRYIGEMGWEGVIQQEVRLAEVLLRYLRSKPEVFEMYGEPTSDREKRVPVISFGVKGRSSREVVERLERKSDFGFRWGHFYSKRLVDDVLRLDEEGVVRVSMLHYNTVEEVEAFVEKLDEECCGSGSKS